MPCEHCQLCKSVSPYLVKDFLTRPRNPLLRDLRQEALPARVVATAEQHEGHCQCLLQAIVEALVEQGLWLPGRGNLSDPSHIKKIQKAGASQVIKCGRKLNAVMIV